jgi:hypothetical protein
MTYGELRFSLSKLAPGLDPDLLDSFINDRFQSITNFQKWKDAEVDGTLTTVIGQGLPYAMPDDFRLPLEGRNPTTDSEIVFISRSELNRLAPTRPMTGEPQLYTLVNATEAEIYPVPTAIETYTFRYIKSFPAFADTDTSLEVPDWISILCLKAGVMADVCEVQKDYNGADRNELKFKTERLKMAVDDSGRKGPARVRTAAKFSPAANYDRRGNSDHRSQMP